MVGGHTSETVDAAISHPVISQVDRSKGKSSRPGKEPRMEGFNESGSAVRGVESTKNGRCRDAEPPKIFLVSSHFSLIYLALLHLQWSMVLLLILQLQYVHHSYL